jgi:hypothetical protein
MTFEIERVESTLDSAHVRFGKFVTTVAVALQNGFPRALRLTSGVKNECRWSVTRSDRG